MKEDIRDEVRAWYMGVKSQTGKFPDLPSEESGGSAVIYTRYKTASSHSKSTSQSSSKGTKSWLIFLVSNHRCLMCICNVMFVITFVRS